MKLPIDFAENRIAWIIRIIAGCLLVQMMISYLLWWPAGRTFPLVPAWSFLPEIKNVFSEWVLPTTFAMGLSILILLPKVKKVILVVLFLALLLIMLDINRLQIWMYQWLSMLLIIALHKDRENSIRLLQFLMIALYIWSGFNKLNVYYLDHSFPYLMEAFDWTKQFVGNTAIALCSAILEIAIGVGLFTAKTNKFAIWLAIGMHTIILLLLGPFGLSENEIIWPWNIAMIMLVFLLFKSDTFSNPIRLWKGSPLAKILMVLWGIMPIFNVSNLWDEQLSFKMYSGTNPEGILFSPSIDEDCLPQSIKVYYTRGGNQPKEERIVIDDWAFLALKTPPYVSQRTLKEIGGEWCNCLSSNDRKGAGLEILRVRRWSRAEYPLLRFSCADLTKF